MLIICIRFLSAGSDVKGGIVVLINLIKYAIGLLSLSSVLGNAGNVEMMNRDVDIVSVNAMNTPGKEFLLFSYFI